MGFMYKDWCIHFYVKIRAWALCTKTGVYIFMWRLVHKFYVQRLVSMIFMSRLEHDMSFCLKTDAYVFYVKTAVWTLCTKTGVFDFYFTTGVWTLCTKTGVYEFICPDWCMVFMYKNWCIWFLCQDCCVIVLYKDWCVQIFMLRLVHELYVQRLVSKDRYVKTGAWTLYKD